MSATTHGAGLEWRPGIRLHQNHRRTSSGNTDDFYLDDLDDPRNRNRPLHLPQGPQPERQSIRRRPMPKASTGSIAAAIRLIIERSRILGTLLVVNPGAGSCIANGPINWSPAVAGYPALLVDADNAAMPTSRSTPRTACSAKRRTASTSIPAGAAHEDFGQDADTNDIYRSVIRGLVAVRGRLDVPKPRRHPRPGDRRRRLNNSSGELEVEFQPDSLLNPPPGFLAPYTYIRRTSLGAKGGAAVGRYRCQVVRCQLSSCHGCNRR